MNVIELIYRLKLAGYSQVRLAEELGVNRGVINDVVHGRSASIRVATRIATVVGEDVEVIWPGRYRRARVHVEPIASTEKGE